MKLFIKPIYIRIRLRTLLILLICLMLLIAGIVLYNTYTFHNLFFRSLTANRIESVQICGDDGQTLTVLDTEKISELVLLLRNIRLRNEPYSDFGILGDSVNDYHIRLKNGIEFDLNIFAGEPACYIINGMAYPIESTDYDSMLLLEAFARENSNA